MSAPTLPAWPDYALPSPSLNDNLQMQYPDTLVRSDFEQGSSRQRNLYQQGATTQWITWPMDPTQARIFHGFWCGELNNGADWFTLDLFVDDCYRPYKCRFVGGQPFKLKRNGGQWEYAAVVETMDETAPDEVCTGALLLTYMTGQTLDYVVGQFHTAVQDLPSSL